MKIVLAVDGSKHSQWAEHLLRRMAGPGHAVEVLFVAPVVQPGTAGEPSITEVLSESGERLVRTVAKGLGKKFKATPRVRTTHDIAGTILEEAKRTKADLIVLGARGLSPIKTFLLGSISNRVMRHADRAVLVAHREPRGRGVLVPLDGSRSGERQLAFLERLGLPRTAPVSLLHVVSDPMAFWIPETGLPGGFGNVAAYQESLRALRERAERLLAEAKGNWRRRFRVVRTLCREGHPAGEILTAAERSKAGVIVLGRRGLSRLDRMFMGSVSQKVSAYASCAVAVVP